MQTPGRSFTVKKLREHEVRILHVRAPRVTAPDVFRDQRRRPTDDNHSETSLSTAKSMSEIQYFLQIILQENDLSDDQSSHSDSGSEFSIDFDDIEFPPVSPRTTELRQSLLANVRRVCWEDSIHFHHARNDNYTPACDVLGVRCHQQHLERNTKKPGNGLSRSFPETIRVETALSFCDNSTQRNSAPVKTFLSIKPTRKPPFVFGNSQEVFGSGLSRKGSLKSHQTQELATLSEACSAWPFQSSSSASISSTYS